MTQRLLTVLVLAWLVPGELHSQWQLGFVAEEPTSIEPRSESMPVKTTRGPSAPPRTTIVPEIYRPLYEGAHPNKSQHRGPEHGFCWSRTPECRARWERFHDRGVRSGMTPAFAKAEIRIHLGNPVSGDDDFDWSDLEGPYMVRSYEDQAWIQFFFAAALEVLPENIDKLDRWNKKISAKLAADLKAGRERVSTRAALQGALWLYCEYLESRDVRFEDAIEQKGKVVGWAAGLAQKAMRQAAEVAQ